MTRLFLNVNYRLVRTHFIQLYLIQGGKIRSKLGAELSGVDGVVIEEGTTGEKGKVAAQNGMRK